MAEQFSCRTPSRPQHLQFVDWRNVLTEPFSQPSGLCERMGGMEEIHAIFDTIEVSVHPRLVERARGGDLAPGVHRSRPVVYAVQDRQEVARERRHHAGAKNQPAPVARALA